jgi:hypothetical protein
MLVLTFTLREEATPATERVRIPPPPAGIRPKCLIVSFKELNCNKKNGSQSGTQLLHSQADFSQQAYMARFRNLGNIHISSTQSGFLFFTSQELRIQKTKT